MPSITSIIFFLAIVVLTLANFVTFINRDGQAREVCWYTPEGVRGVDSDVVPPYGQITTVHDKKGNPLVDGQGYMFKVRNQWDGQNCFLPNVVGEIVFNGWGGVTTYDISAVDNLNANNGIHRMYPTYGGGTVCGCDVFPCNAPCVYLCPGCAQPGQTFVTDITVELWAA